MLDAPRSTLALGVLLASSATAAAQSVPPRVAIDGAIERGIEFLLARQNRDGSWDAEMHERNAPHHDYRNGPTALVLHALLECGLDRDHPAIQRTLAYLAQVVPDRTYAISVELQALSALGEHADRARVDALTKRLLDVRVDGKGGWEYPTFTPGLVDLSNTQYAALGLRAASALGVQVPHKVWSNLARCALDFQEKPRSVPAPLRPGETGTGKREVAGFAYKTDRSERPSASMTAAGITTSTVATQALGERIDGDLSRRSERARALALAWLEDHWSVSTNPDGDAAWHFYYMYGLERVGALLALERIGDHDWYAEGAVELIRLQKPDGSWSRDAESVWAPQPFANGNTCFALLFLTRATAPRTGESRAPPPAIFTAEDPACEVAIRAAGARTSRFLVTGFGASALERHGRLEGADRRLAVAAVRWLVDGAEVNAIAFDPPAPWTGERFAYEHAFSENGAHVVECRVDVAPAEGGAGPGATLRSAPLEVLARDVLEGWMLEYARAGSRNLLGGRSFEAHASSQRSDRHLAGDACDGLQFSAWVAADDDPAPRWTLELEKALRVRAVVLSQAAANATQLGEYGRIARVSLSLDGGKPREFALDEDPIRKTVCELPRSDLAKHLEIRVLALAPEGPARAGGLAEVELR